MPICNPPCRAILVHDQRPKNIEHARSFSEHNAWGRCAAWKCGQLLLTCLTRTLLALRTAAAAEKQKKPKQTLHFWEATHKRSQTC